MLCLLHLSLGPAISVSSSIAKYGCTDQCGELSIPFPFGIGKNCSLAPSFEIFCNRSTYPPTAYLRILNAEISELMNSSQVLVRYRYQPGLVCYNLSDYYHGRMGKIEERRLIIDLSRTQYTLTDENQIAAVGCDDMVVGTFGQSNESALTRSSCANVCSDRRQYGYSYRHNIARCPSGEDMYIPGEWLLHIIHS